MDILVLNKLDVGNLLFQKIRRFVEKRIRNDQLIHIQVCTCFFNSEKQRVYIPEYEDEICFETFDTAEATLVAYRYKEPKTGADMLVYANEIDVEALADV